MTLEALFASAIALVAAVGLYLLLQPRAFSVALGLTLLSYAVNAFLFAAGRLWANVPPIVDGHPGPFADPLPQALILTAIVIGFATTAYLLALTVRRLFATGSEEAHFACPERKR